jgi:hypothetical protein
MRFEGFFASFSPSFDESRLTAPSLTPNATAISFCCQPSSFNFHARFRRSSRQSAARRCSHASYRITLDFPLPMSVNACKSRQRCLSNRGLVINSSKLCYSLLCYERQSNSSFMREAELPQTESFTFHSGWCTPYMRVSPESTIFSDP